MPDSAVLYIFFTGLFIFFTGAIISLLLHSGFRISTLISYTSAIVASACGIFVSLLKLSNFLDHPVSFELTTNIEFLKLSFVIDNLSAFFILLISFLTLVVSIYSFGYVKHYENKRNTALLGALYNLFAASMLLVVTSGQIFLFLISWEIMSLVSYFLVVYENDNKEVQKAGLIYIIMTHIGTAFITAGFVLLYKFTGQTVINMIDPALIPDSTKSMVFILLFVGFGTKAGIIPLHIWLPYAHPAAPSNVSALMSGVLIKTAIYGIVRFVLETLSPEFHWWGIVILVIGAISTVLGVAFALMEHNIKRLLAYHSIENIGIILMGVGLCVIATASGNYTLAALSLTAALFHTFNHSVFKGLLFLGAGSIHFATGTKDIEKLGGLIKKMPYTAIFFLIASLSICAIPPFNGFVSEWLTYQAMFLGINSGSTISNLIILISAALLALAGALAAYCFVKVFGVSFLALPRTQHAADAVEVNRPMLAGMGVLTTACIFLGVLPSFFVKLLDAVNLQLFDTAITGNISSFSSFISYPLKAGGASIFPAGLLLIALLLFSILAFIIILTTSKTKIRKYGTWDCGYKNPDSGMQYSATGFSKPARIVFRSIFRPQRELKVEDGIGPYFVKAAKYNVSTLSVFEKYFYNPLIKKVINFARKARFTIQTGSIHTYLLYIFVTILLMFVYYAVSYR
ncbi:MAG: hydrogenase 4 subunit B [Ruminiclostridium sp.]|nr:hydrogenase 4 subunit B [Ruminiclostridium sp.]